MNRKSYQLVYLFSVFTVLFSCSTEPAPTIKIGEIRNIEARERTIDVSGTAEKIVDADEIIFSIGIQEYYKEEFMKGKKWQDYKTKVSIAGIEQTLFSKLEAIGINPKDVTVESIGEYWGGEGRKFNQSKHYSIKITDFDLVERLTNIKQFKGLEYLRIQEMKNKDIEQIRKDLKIEALKAAKEKAQYLVESMDKQIGDVISINENSSNHNYVYFNATSDNSGEKPNYRSIHVTSSIQATFEIK